MTDVEIKLNSVAWEMGNGSEIADPMVYGVVVTKRGKNVQLGSMRLSDVHEHVLRVLKKGPPKEEQQ